jgi:transcriptional regulator with XRE-family HTH domain
MIGNRDKKVLRAFGNNLKKIRLSKKLSIRKLALEAEIDYSHLNEIEKGRTNPTLTTILVLAAALEIDPCQLLTFGA